ncbi:MULTISPECIES: hypothetical protein [Niastella]|uniref:DUF5045 domain-containing protein n=1 Tax=Niastella soli TaxID=2821487 RepID=A0ABS3Z0R6_9BACT|nr:hypothetical protein [Niastella soli]MBO9203761.1 hypothetical protein [Niastella soli]
MYKLPLIIWMMLLAYTAESQSTPFDILKYVDQLPPIAASASDAYQQSYPKGKRTPYQQYEAVLDAQINELTDLSKHQSGLLSYLSGRSDRESRIYDFGKMVKAEDLELKKKQEEQIHVFFNYIDDYNRATSWTIDSIRKNEENYGVQAAKMVRVYQQAAPVFVKKLRLLTKEMNDLLNKKGYNTILNNQVQTHKYYIQLLEVRGLLLDRIRQVCRMIGGSSDYVAVIQAEALK